MLIASRDEEILHTLSRKVRLFSLAQLAARWWSPTGTGTANARKRLGQMLDAHLLERHHLTARPLPALDDPVVRWQPGESPPDFGATAWQLRSRWTEAPRSTTVYIATSRAANLYGGRHRGRLTHPHQASHDLGVSAVYLRLLELDPQAAGHWRGEDLLPSGRFGGKVPDAVLVEPSGSVRQVIEFGGAYDKARVRTFHHCCAQQGLPYEVW